LNPTALHTQAHSQDVVACVWDFDKTLIPGYMQTPLFSAYGIDEGTFWKEVNTLPDLYAKRGLRVSKDTIYLNHLLSHVKSGSMRGLTNQKLKDLGKDLKFFPGLPEFFTQLTKIPQESEFSSHNFKVEHYIISTGLAQMIRGSAIFPFVEDVFACEFIESVLDPNFTRQSDLELTLEPEISQVGMSVDNTIKTRFIFEINKGCNKNQSIDVNAAMPHMDRRIPIDQIIYVADGPSDVPVFAVVKQMGGKTYAVYDPQNENEFAQTCELVESSRVHNNGPADYRENSSTAIWVKQKTRDILRKMIKKRVAQLEQRSLPPPQHLSENTVPKEIKLAKQDTFWE